MNIIVTGASRGIGKQLVINFTIMGGHRIIAISRNESKLLKLKAHCEEISESSEVIAMPFDLETGDYKNLAREIKRCMPQVHIFINNAGSLVNKSIAQLSGRDFDHMMNTNVRPAFLLVRSLLPHFGNPSHIVNISSMGGYQGSVKFPGLSLYSASKAALAVLSECLAVELTERGISVNCLALGAAQTEMLSEAFPAYKAPLSATEMAGYIADFALTGHRYYNGKILPLSLSTP